jgi:alpha-tubulin suppressor-like RCC1 family protein
VRFDRHRRDELLGISNAPVPLLTAPALSSLAIGWNFDCGMGSDGIAYCWGQNESGQVGDGTTTFRPHPTPIHGQ